jgi:hypothetical protein
VPSDPPLGGAHGEFEVRLIHPFQARKRYVCPGCNHAIESGTGHVVVVPLEAPDLRRHWHRPCWEAEKRRDTARRDNRRRGDR